MFKLRHVVLLMLLLVVVLPVVAQEPLIGIGTTESLGDVLVGEGGLTLYMFSNDPLGESVCVDACAERWPPLLVDSAEAVTVAEGVPGVFGAVPYGDSMIATYNGLPLYYWQNDEAPGDTNGQAVGNVWWVIAPGQAVYPHRNAELGHILVGTEGMTLYRFAPDEMGESTCYDDCATNWPPLLSEDMEEVVGDPRIDARLGTVERTDGTYQVTYNGWPLYYFAQDMAPGDTVGEGRGENWWTITPEALSVVANDEAGVSNCTEACLENWPAVRVLEGDRLVGGEGVMGELGSIVRADNNQIQLTYNGMPLYYFAEDAAPGDTTGQGRGDVWYVVAP
jgi:predicted lipoprotein with Yx(FWY)xxD motif